MGRDCLTLHCLITLWLGNGRTAGAQSKPAIEPPAHETHLSSIGRDRERGADGGQRGQRGRAGAGADSVGRDGSRDASANGGGQRDPSPSGPAPTDYHLSANMTPTIRVVGPPFSRR